MKKITANKIQAHKKGRVSEYEAKKQQELVKTRYVRYLYSFFSIFYFTKITLWCMFMQNNLYQLTSNK